VHTGLLEKTKELHDGWLVCTKSQVYVDGSCSEVERASTADIQTEKPHESCLFRHGLDYTPLVGIADRCKSAARNSARNLWRFPWNNLLQRKMKESQSIHTFK
jgi:hypothetical protein